ncbi:MAG: DNA repair protein RadC [Bacteroidota bacterium]
MEYDEPRLSIREWAEDDRPREKLVSKGKSALSDAELLALLLRSGSRNESAVELGRRILNRVNGNLIGLSKLSLAELITFKGVGEAKAIAILAALELGRRRREAEVEERKAIVTSRDVFEFMQSNLSDIGHEEFWVLLLSRSNKIIKKIPISEGGLTGTVADPRRIFRAAVEHGCCSMILCHNHPSGNVQPSDADIKLTRKLKDAGTLLDITVLDHVICGEENFFSFADEGMM